jgi:cation diffusion facilitator family transporter
MSQGHEDRQRSHEDSHDAHVHTHKSHGPLARLRELVVPHSHDAADSVDDALEASAEGIRAVKISLVVLGVTAAAQAVLVLMTGSVALLADTIHNLSDALTAVPLWIAFVVGRRRPTRAFTYGYGRAEDLAGIFIVAMIALSAVVAGYESIRRLLDPQPIALPWMVAAAGVIGFVGNEVVAAYRIRVGRRIGSAALVADGRHARADGFTSLAVVVGALGVLAGFPLADPVVGLVITLAILVVLRGAARDIYHRLMDAVNPSLTEMALACVAATPGVREVGSFRVRWIGHRLHAETGIEVDLGLDLIAAHEIANTVHHRLLHTVPKLVDVTVHVSPHSVDGTDFHPVLGHQTGA